MPGQSSEWWESLVGSLVVTAAASPVIGLTLLAWAWRYTEPSWLLPTLLVTEIVLLVAALWFGRRQIRGAVRVVVRLRGLPLLVLLPLALAGATATQSLPVSADPPGRVAVVGGGTAGLHAAWMLDRMGVDYTLFEATEVVGGHAFTHTYVDADDDTLPVDMGFIFGAPSAYEELKAMLARYDVERAPATLDLSVRVGETAWTTGGELPPEVARFAALADAHCDDDSLNLVPFGWWLYDNGFDAQFIDDYLTPFFLILFATERGIYQVSTRFMLNMTAGRRRWLSFETGGDVWTIVDGSEQYYDKLGADLASHIRLRTPVTRIERVDGRVRLTAVGPEGPLQEVYDAVILAVSADVARQLLSDRSWLEDLILAQVRYSDHEVLLHTDLSAVPEPELRRSYNYRRYDTGWELSSLPALSTPGRLDPVPVGTLNPQRDYSGVQFRRTWHHFPMDLWHLATVLEMLPRIQGNGGVYYAGDWVSVVGHGPAMRTGVHAACEIGGTTPRPDLTTAPCFGATLIDATEDQPADTVTLCGERGLFEQLVALACPDVEPGPARASYPTPPPAAEVPLDLAGFDGDSLESRYQRYCFACHGTGAAEAPRAGDREAWQKRGDIDALLASAIRGQLAMPPRGGCQECDDADLRALIEHMVEP